MKGGSGQGGKEGRGVGKGKRAVMEGTRKAEENIEQLRTNIEQLRAPEPIQNYTLPIRVRR